MSTQRRHGGKKRERWGTQHPVAWDRRGWRLSSLMAARSVGAAESLVAGGWLMAVTPGWAATRGWRRWLAVAVCAFGSVASPIWAADGTAPTTPVVTDDGTYTTGTTSLHATWTSSDPESGIAEYQYLIRQDSTSGAIIVNFTSTGTTASVTRTDLSLLQGKWYYIGVKAKNGAGLWSAIGYSNGIRVDTTAPSAPPQPTEGSTTDYDYDSDGAYYVYWYASPLATDAESGIAAYELQERLGADGAWTTVVPSTTARYAYRSGRLDKTQYFYQVRAKNGVGMWSAWSPISDGILIDKTAPAPVATVTDDGATTASTTTLHATWTPSSDPDSGMTAYEYLIRQDAPSGAVIVTYTAVGLLTEVTRTGLSLLPGKLYFIGVRAKNGAGWYSTLTYSDGIRTPDPTPPTAPGQPQEGSSNATIDYDYDGDGSYYVSWSAATDSDSGIASYELQQRIGSTGTWTTVATPTSAYRYTYLSGRLDKIQYFYQVRAKNGAGAFGDFSPVSDSLLVDKTAPTAVTVTDDGLTTFSTTTLHAAWTSSSDAESGIAEYQYLIRQDSTSGPIIVNYTSVGTATQVTRTGLSLINGKKYFIAVRAKNGAGLYSALRYADGITIVVDTTPPVITITSPLDGALIGR